MIRTGKLDMSPSNRKAVKSDGGRIDLHVSRLIVSQRGEEPSPNAFLVEQGPNVTVRAHFHENSQWQVFVNGDGALGRNPVQPFTVQYVAPHTGYGPIAAGPLGLWYMTLRPSWQTGAKYLPDQRDQLDRSLPKRQVTSASFPPGRVNADEPMMTMIAPQEDGLAAWMMHIPTGEAARAPDHPGGLARYYLVAQGEMIVEGEQLGPLSVTWAPGVDSLPAIRAGARGVDVIVLQFPGNAW